MAVQQFDFDKLDVFKGSGKFLDGSNKDYKTIWSPIDNVHGLLVCLLSSVQHSIVLNMYGYDDSELDLLIQGHAATPGIYVQMSLDKTQAAGKAEKAILDQWNHSAMGTSIAIGTSSKHAISHLKVLIVDGIYTVSGSTNWSIGGEQKQDNELTISRDPVRAAEFRAVLDRNHDFMLKQMRPTA